VPRKFLPLHEYRPACEILTLVMVRRDPSNRTGVTHCISASGLPFTGQCRIACLPSTIFTSCSYVNVYGGSEQEKT
jgi:hypothetical protein